MVKDEDCFGRVVRGVRLEKLEGRKELILLPFNPLDYESSRFYAKDQTRVGAAVPQR